MIPVITRCDETFTQRNEVVSRHGIKRSHMTHPDKLSDVGKYRRGWVSGGAETKCGFGSKLNQTVFQRKWIPAMVAKYGILDIADIGAGDLNWIKQTVLGCAYRGYDLVPRHPDVQEFDLLKDELPQADCLMVLWVLNHLPPDMQEIAINKLKNSGARFLMMTYDKLMEPCTDLNPIETEVLRKARDGRDLEIRLIKL